MFFFSSPQCEEIVVTNEINPRVLMDACDAFLYGFEEYMGDFTETHVLNIIDIIYDHTINPYQYLRLDEEIGEKRYEDAKISLLKKTEEVRQGNQETRRKRVVQFLSITENPKLQKYKAVLSQVLSSLDSEYS